MHFQQVHNTYCVNVYVYVNSNMYHDRYYLCIVKLPYGFDSWFIQSVSQSVSQSVLLFFYSFLPSCLPSFLDSFIPSYICEQYIYMQLDVHLNAHAYLQQNSIHISVGRGTQIGPALPNKTERLLSSSQEFPIG